MIDKRIVVALPNGKTHYYDGGNTAYDENGVLTVSTVGGPTRTTLGCYAPGNWVYYGREGEAKNA